MGILFNAADVFEIAIQVERNGARYYRAAAAQIPDAQSRHELLELAAMEDNHEVTFTELKASLVGNDASEDWFDPESDAAKYLEAFAAGQIFDMTEDPCGFLGPETPLIDVIEFALERERDSVVFFVGLKELVPASLGATKIEAIIKQEMGHIALLSKRLREVGLAA